MTLPESPKVYLCQECGERCDDPLVAPDPFNPETDLYACQHCRTPECLQRACVIEGCKAPPSAGTPGAHGHTNSTMTLATERKRHDPTT